MSDSKLDELFDQLADNHTHEQVENREPKTETNKQRKLHERCAYVASFSLDRVVVRPERNPASMLFHQWACAWRRLSRSLKTAGFEDRVKELDAGDDVALAIALQLLSRADEAGGINDVEECLEKSAQTPARLRSILNALRELPERLTPVETTRVDDAAMDVLSAPSNTVAPADKVHTQRAPGVSPANYAIAQQDGKKWICFRKYHHRWQHHSVFRVAKGRETVFLTAFQEGGGFLEKVKAIKLVNAHPSGGEARRIMDSIVKSVIFRLREKICQCLKLPDGVDPLPWQDDVDAKGWRAAIVIGYATSEASRHASGKETWVIKTAGQL